MNCPIYKKCGSCQYIHIDYFKQLLEKREYCQKLFQSFKVNVHPVNGMKHPYEYRNKVIVAFNTQYLYGMYEESSHRIVPMEQCLLHDDVTHQVLKQIQTLLKRYRVSIYDEKRNKGFLKYVLIRRAVKTNQTLVCLVATEDNMKGSKNFCQELIKKCPTVQSVVMNVNKRKTSVVLSSQEKILYGKGFIVDQLCGLSFKISAQSFYQINHEQCTQLYNKVIELLKPKETDVVLDTYCGIGTIGLIVANHVKNVIGVELNSQAYQDAILNAKMNKISNIQFKNQDATEFMKNMATSNIHIDSVIMDPPRAGSTKEFIDTIQVLKPTTIVYVSCDPVTQARDLKDFERIGYKFEDVYLYDMFPQTGHVETVCLLTRKEK